MHTACSQLNFISEICALFSTHGYFEVTNYLVPFRSFVSCCPEYVGSTPVQKCWNVINTCQDSIFSISVRDPEFICGRSQSFAVEFNKK